jgi:N utilization substance protein A
VDIIRWDPNPKVFITNALAPAKLKLFDLDETNRRARITVAEDQLSLAIGKRGQNARLTSKLTGWHIDIEAEVVAPNGFEEQKAKAILGLAGIPGITQEQADSLVNAGITSLEMLLQVEQNDLEEIPVFQGKAGEILEAARNEFGRRSIPLGGTVSH